MLLTFWRYFSENNTQVYRTWFLWSVIATCKYGVGTAVHFSWPWAAAVNCDNTVDPSWDIFTYTLTAGVVGAAQMTSQPVSSIFLCSALPSGTLRTPGPSISWYFLPTSFFFCLSCLLPFFQPWGNPFLVDWAQSTDWLTNFPAFTVPCKMVSARPDEWKTCPYHFSWHLLMMVRRFLCGPIVCWILAQTSLFVTWSLYKMRDQSFLWPFCLFFSLFEWTLPLHTNTWRNSQLRTLEPAFIFF